MQGEQVTTVIVVITECFSEPEIHCDIMSNKFGILPTLTKVGS